MQRREAADQRSLKAWGNDRTHLFPPIFPPRGTKQRAEEGRTTEITTMAAAIERKALVVGVEEMMTSGASGRVRSLMSPTSVRRLFVFLQSFFLSVVAFLRLRRGKNISSLASVSVSSPRRTHGGGGGFRLGRWDEEDTLKRRNLAVGVEMVVGEEDGTVPSWETWTFVGSGRNSLFCRSWSPATGKMRGILVVIHGLNEHSGRYAHFAMQLTSSNFGVYAMDWMGHGGSDGLHGYVQSLDHVIADTGAFLDKIKSENPGVPCFLFGHSTGGAVVLKAASYPYIRAMVEGIILTSPALRVKPAHPIVGAVAPIFSILFPRLQIKGANKRGIPVSRDPAAMLAKYSDPLVYTGPIRVRTGHEILRLSSHLMQNIRSVTVPFLVLHGTADRVTDPLASQDLYNEAESTYKDIKLYQGFLHDLLFEPERDEIYADIIGWMERKLLCQCS